MQAGYELIMKFCENIGEDVVTAKKADDSTAKAHCLCADVCKSTCDMSAPTVTE